MSTPLTTKQLNTIKLSPKARVLARLEVLIKTNRVSASKVQQWRRSLLAVAGTER